MMDDLRSTYIHIHSEEEYREVCVVLEQMGIKFGSGLPMTSPERYYITDRPVFHISSECRVTMCGVYESYAHPYYSAAEFLEKHGYGEITELPDVSRLYELFGGDS